MPTVRKSFLVTEVLVGLVFVGLGTYGLINALNCPDDIGECKAWGGIFVGVWLIPGGLAACVGIYTLLRKSTSLALTQIGLLVVLTVYFMWLFRDG